MAFEVESALANKEVVCDLRQTRERVGFLRRNYVTRPCSMGSHGMGVTPELVARVFPERCMDALQYHRVNILVLLVVNRFTLDHQTSDVICLHQRLP